MLEFYEALFIFIGNMTVQNNVNKSKRLKAVRMMMYLDALLLLLSVALLDFQDLSFDSNSVSYTRILILIVVYGVLYVTEKNICRYLRKHRDGGEVF